LTEIIILGYCTIYLTTKLTKKLTEIIILGYCTIYLATSSFIKNTTVA